MSIKRQMVEIMPTTFNDCNESMTLEGFVCPYCSGQGEFVDSRHMRDEPVITECSRCKGSGELKAFVEIAWSAGEKKSNND